MLRHYYYNHQLKKFITGFGNIFAGLQVQTGLDACGERNMIDVPIKYGSSDRVTSAIGAANTQNKQYTLPMMACYMSNLNLAPERMHGVNQVDRRTVLEQGGIYPDDLKGVKRLMPIPFNMEMELSIHASNTDQMFQILEQILMLFDYDMQIQFNDAAFDWTKITKVTLVGLTNEENYPMGVERRNVIWTLQFELPIWLSPPMELRKEIVQEIRLRIGDVDNLTLDEIDDEGNLVPFVTPYSETVISAPSGEPSEPPTNQAYTAQHYDPGLDDCKC